MAEELGGRQVGEGFYGGMCGMMSDWGGRKVVLVRYRGLPGGRWGG